MKKTLRLFVILIISLILIAVPVIAKEKTINLLAVEESEGEYKGSVATLSLELKPGEGKVFLDTLPLTKISTQMSMRFAKQLACKDMNADCRSYDFFYKIRARAGIVGGPSAGAAAAVLTMAYLNDLDVRDDAAITGTINSGGLIGPVGEVKEKIDGAIHKNMTTVIIPKWSTLEPEEDEIETDLTFDFVEYGKNNSIEVIEASDINDALFYLTGFKKQNGEQELKIDNFYNKKMSEIADVICGKNEELKEKFESVRPEKIKVELEETEEYAVNFSRDAERLMEDKNYYSAASYCFRSNINYRYLWYTFEGMDEDDINDSIQKTQELIDKARRALYEKEITSITDLQTFVAVEGRLTEAYEQLNETIHANQTDEKIKLLAYTVERMNSAASWSYFFGAGEEEPFKINDKVLRSSCINVISEAEERINYIGLFIPRSLITSRNEIKKAHEDLSKGEYALCLFRASKAKAETNTVLSLFGIENEQAKEVFDVKIKAAMKSILESQKRNIFPIIGYSYYEYANILKEEDITTALLFSEYAIELSNMDVYFEQDNKVSFADVDGYVKPLIVGFIIGLIIMWAILYPQIGSKRPKKRSKRKKR